MKSEPVTLTNTEKVQIIMREVIGRPITPKLMREVEMVVEQATGRKCWCDRGLNPPQFTASGILRVVFMEGDYRIVTATIQPPARSVAEPTIATH